MVQGIIRSDLAGDFGDTPGDLVFNQPHLVGTADPTAAPNPPEKRWLWFRTDWNIFTHRWTGSAWTRINHLDGGERVIGTYVDSGVVVPLYRRIFIGSLNNPPSASTSDFAVTTVIPPGTFDKLVSLNGFLGLGGGEIPITFSDGVVSSRYDISTIARAIVSGSTSFGQYRVIAEYTKP